MSKIKLASMERTSIACPSQWEGFADDGRQLYIRLRSGRFEITISKGEETDIFKTINDGEVIFEANQKEDSRIEDEHFMTNDELIEYTAGLFDWSSVTNLKGDF